MIKEAIIAGTGILFKNDCLKSLNFDFMELASELDRVGLDFQRTGLDPALLESPVFQPMPSKRSKVVSVYALRYTKDYTFTEPGLRWPK